MMRSGPPRPTDGAGRRAQLAWAVPVAVVAYLLFATADWRVPDPRGIAFAPAWLVATGGLLGAWRAARRRLTPLVVVAAAAAVAMVLTDVSYLTSANLRDLGIYLRAGERFAAGEPVYLDRLVTARPDDLPSLPYLYPPVTLPAFALLARLPEALVGTVWLAGSVAAVLAALRLWGLPLRWAVLALAWPPIFQGLQVGNVAAPVALLFAAAPWLGGGLVLGGLFKPQAAGAALWLVREQRWRALVAGLVAALGLCLASLPLAGPERWAEWWRALALYAASQPLVPGSLYGFSLLHYLPPAAAAAGALVLVLLALRARGRAGLGRLGLATAVASPSLYSHGLIVGLPAFLELRPLALWTALAITAVSPGVGWWGAVGLAATAWLVPALRRPDTSGRSEDARADAALDPAPRGPWPAAPIGSGNGGGVDAASRRGVA